MRLWKPPHTGLSHDADVSFMLQTRAARLCMFLFCASRLRHQYSRNSTSVRYRHDVMLSTREDVIRRRHALLRCADSSLNHEWSKTASFVLCLDAVGVRPPCEMQTAKQCTWNVCVHQNRNCFSNLTSISLYNSGYEHSDYHTGYWNALWSPGVECYQEAYRLFCRESYVT
jgi:hypothetical protein